MRHVAETFNRYFEIVLADTEELKQQSYKIRHSVYAEELAWEPQNEFGMEMDEYDPYSYSILLRHKRSGSYTGTARLIIPPENASDRKLPFESHCIDSILPEVLDPKSLNSGKFAELSRLCVLSSFRRRIDEHQQAFVLSDYSNKMGEPARRDFPTIALSLYLGVIAMAKLAGQSHLLVVMETRLQSLLARLDIDFIRCGQDLDYFGVRALYCLPLEDFNPDQHSEIFGLYQFLYTRLESQFQPLLEKIATQYSGTSDDANASGHPPQRN